MAALETHRINWESYQFKSETLDETKVNMINFLFNVISDSDFNSVCFKYFEAKRVSHEESYLWMYKRLGWKNT